MTQRAIGATLSGDWWVRFDPIDGWESHDVEVRVDLVGGQPRVTGLRLTPRVNEDAEEPATADHVLTGSRLRTVPVAALAPAAMSLMTMDLRLVARRLAAIARRRPPRADPRARTTVEQVAEAYATARKAGLSPRAEVCRTLHVSPRTADRYLAQARRRGLLATAGTSR